MKNIQHLSLDIMNNHIFEYAYSKQYDEGRTLLFTVTENGLPYDLTGVLATFQMRKPDDTIIFDTGIIEDNKIKIIVTSQMTVMAGKLPYQIQLIKDNVSITTVTGFFKISKSVVDPDDIMSTNEFNALNDALIKVNTDYTLVMESAQASANAAKISEENASISEENSLASSNLAKSYAENALTHSNSANGYAENASKSANSANVYAIQANSAKNVAQTMSEKAIEASNLAKSYAIGGTESRENENIDNSKYYYEQAKKICESISGALRPMGTVTFDNLPTIDDSIDGDMYNVSNEFITNSTFKEGSGYTYPAGTNVYKTKDGYWDCLAGIPLENIDALKANGGDTKDNIVSFVNDDIVSDETTYLPTDNNWLDVAPIQKEEKFSSIFNKISRMFHNLRYLYKILGTTDISLIGDGSVTGIIKSLNDSLVTVSDNITFKMNTDTTIYTQNVTVPEDVKKGRGIILIIYCATPSLSSVDVTKQHWMRMGVSGIGNTSPIIGLSNLLSSTIYLPTSTSTVSIETRSYAISTNNDTYTANITLYYKFIQI